MKCIDFDQHFQQYLADWMKANEEKYDGNVDEMEDMMPEVYMDYLEKPADWLDGLSPVAYFDQFENARQLVAWLGDYVDQKTPVPDLLLDRIAELGDEAEAALMEEIGCGGEKEMMIISLLEQLESTEPMGTYIDYIASCCEQDDKADRMAEALTHMGSVVIEPIFDVVDDACEEGRNIFADILSNFPGEDRTLRLMLERFENAEGKRALFASYLAKLGDDRALPTLMEAAEDRDVDYLDYVEIVNAIEALGGERPSEREFAGDPFYESLKCIDQGVEIRQGKGIH